MVNKCVYLYQYKTPKRYEYRLKTVCNGLEWIIFHRKSGITSSSICSRSQSQRRFSHFVQSYSCHHLM